MILRQLYITDEIGCEFHDGLNIILGINQRTRPSETRRVIETGEPRSEPRAEFPLLDRDHGAGEPDHPSHTVTSGGKVSDTNGVGKSLVVSILKHILGGDTEISLASSYFADKGFWGTLEVETGRGPLTIARPLWRPLAENLYLVIDERLDKFLEYLVSAKVKLEDVTNARELAEQIGAAGSPLGVLSKGEFQNRIAKLENIDYSQSNITFSSLLDFIIRDEKVGFSDPISRIRRAQWVQYRSVQSLFGLPASAEEVSSKLQEEVASLRLSLGALQEELDTHGITGDDKIENLKLSATARLLRIREDIEQVRVAPALEKTRTEYREVRAEFTEIVAALSKKERYLRGYESNRTDLRDKSKAITELLKVEEFYDDLVRFFPEQLAQNISEFQAFFDNLSDDRERYYADLIAEIRADIKLLQARRNHLEPILDALAKQFRSTSLLRDISTLAAGEERIQGEIRSLEKLRGLLLERDNTQERIEELNSLRRATVAKGKQLEGQFRSRRRMLINLFHELISEIYGVDDGELAFEYNSNLDSSTAGRTEVTCSIPSQSSHGRTYARINIFDFVWFLGEKGDGDFRPGFLAHDGSYSKISRDVKAKMLKAVASRLGERQYIITINEGELDMTPEWEECVCCRLDGSEESGKFFHEQFD